MKTKQEIFERWGKAAEFRFFSDGPDKLAEIFPDRHGIECFYDDLAKTRWSESYGQSPYDDAFCLAYSVRHGISDSTRRYLKANADCQAVKNRIACLKHWGIKLD
jgi:hypothetical protein